MGFNKFGIDFRGVKSFILKGFLFLRPEISIDEKQQCQQGYQQKTEKYYEQPVYAAGVFAKSACEFL